MKSLFVIDNGSDSISFVISDNPTGVVFEIGPNMAIIAPFTDGRLIKENIIRLALNGKAIKASEKYRSILGKESEYTLAGSIQGAVKECHINLRRDMYFNIIISGKNYANEDFKKEIDLELKKTIPKSVPTKYSLNTISVIKKDLETDNIIGLSLE